MFHSMRNATIYGTVDLIDRFMSALQERGPRDSSNEVSLQKGDAGGGVDARIRWQVAGQSFEFALDVKVSPPNATPTYLRTTVERRREIPVLVAPFLSRPMQEQLERTGVSYWDPTGNLLLQSRDPFMWVKEVGATKNPNPEPVRTALRSLSGRSASEVIVRLLANGSAATVRDLARESGVSLGTVSRVVSLLRDEDLLTPTGGPIVVRDRLRLAQRWTEEYSFAKTYKAKRYFSILGSGAALARIRESGEAYAITGLAAQTLWYEAEARVAPLPSSELWLYTDDVERIVEIADLVPDSANGTIMVAHADFFRPGRENYRPVGDTRTAWPWRVVGDLMSLSGRYAAAGADFAEELTDRTAGPDA